MKNRAYKERRTAVQVLPPTTLSDPEATVFRYEKSFSADRNRGSHMLRQLLLTLTILVFAACLTPAMGQISVADTFKVVDVTAAAGSIVPVKVLVTNKSYTLMGMTAFFQIDTNVVRYVVEEGYVRMELAERGLTVIMFSTGHSRCSRRIPRAPVSLWLATVLEASFTPWAAEFSCSSMCR